MSEAKSWSNKSGKTTSAHLRRVSSRRWMQRHGQTLSVTNSWHSYRNRAHLRRCFDGWWASILFSARINADIACAAARALSEAGWRTAQAMAEEHVGRAHRGAEPGRLRPLMTRAHRACSAKARRCCWSNTRVICASCARQPAPRPQAERKAPSRRSRGLGRCRGRPSSFREVQTIWDELYPFPPTSVPSTLPTSSPAPRYPGTAGLVPARRLPPVFATALAQAARRHDIDAIRGEEPA